VPIRRQAPSPKPQKVDAPAWPTPNSLNLYLCTGLWT
jgi:hypothetical protein